MTLVCIDSMISPTYHFGGLAYGNLHSMQSKTLTSYPQKAALESLEKMYLAQQLGVIQFVLPPYQKDYIVLMEKIGLKKDDLDGLFNQLLPTAKAKVSALYSGAAAWMANAWTTTASSDSADKRCHITIANLASNVHRVLDVELTTMYAHYLFSDTHLFKLHPALTDACKDEGAANIIRLSSNDKGVYLFVYGESNTSIKPQKYPARQQKIVWEKLVENHQLSDQSVCYLQQSPQVIDAGVFHNDVIAFGLDRLLVVHEQAFVDQKTNLAKLKQQFETVCKQPLLIYEISTKDIPLQAVVDDYFFNSQLIRNKFGHYTLICSDRCQNKNYMTKIVTQLSIMLGDKIDCEYIKIDESLKNGGGPACLRNMLELNNDQIKSMPQHLLLTPTVYTQLKQYILNHYPLEFCLSNVMDPKKIQQFQTIIRDCHDILRLDLDKL